MSGKKYAMEFSIVPASSANKKDLVSALNIYTKSVDSNSITNTNEILYYIENPKIDAERDMLFYILYFNSEVCGFAELGYINKVSILMLDYLCTEPRNQTLFYNFYRLILDDIHIRLKKQTVYIITELTTSKNSDKKLCDADSNYFRKVLSFENFKIIKGLYYQPSLGRQTNSPEIECNLAICGNLVRISSKEFLNIIKHIFFDHYLTWYSKFHSDKNDVEKYLEALYERIKDELPTNESIYSAEFLLVNCKIYEEGKCTQIDIQNLTNKRKKRKLITRVILLALIAFVSISTILLSIFLQDNKVVPAVGSFLTIALAVLEIIRNLKSSWT